MALVKELSIFAIPVLFLIILSVGMFRGIKVYEVFVEEAREGISTILRIIPPLVGLLAAVSVMRASGALELVIDGIKPLASVFGIPKEALPLAIMRPISGSASLAIVSDTLKVHGPDSLIGKIVSTMMGSTETIFYTLAVYFGAVGIKNIRYTLMGALVADIVSVVASVLICTLVFG